MCLGDSDLNTQQRLANSADGLWATSVPSAETRYDQPIMIFLGMLTGRIATTLIVLDSLLHCATELSGARHFMQWFRWPSNSV